mgnify:FL=1
MIQGMKDLGPAKAVLLIVTAQLATAYLIEVFGLFGAEKVPFEWRRLFGLLLSVAGIIIFQK